MRPLRIPIAIAIPGVGLTATTDGVAFPSGSGLIGVAAVALVSLALLEVDLSEERRRTADERTRGNPRA